MNPFTGEHLVWTPDFGHPRRERTPAERLEYHIYKFEGVVQHNNTLSRF